MFDRNQNSQNQTAAQESMSQERREQLHSKLDQSEKRRKYTEALVDTQGEFIRTSIVGIVLAALCVSLSTLGGSSFTSSLVALPLVFPLPFGWKLLTYFQIYMPRFVTSSVWVYCIWLSLKLVLCFILGIPSLIYQAYKTFAFHRSYKAAQDTSVR